MVATGNNRAISDLEFDLVTVLKDKSEALQAYDQYIEDARQLGSQPCAELFQKLQQEDMRHAEEVRRHLKEVMEKGKM